MIRVAFAAAILLWAVIGVAAEFPVKPLRMVVPFPPGGLLDMLARGLGPQLGAHLGQPVVVENRPGANGSIGADAVAKAAPDGHTLFITSVGAVAINPSVRRDLPYDPVKDFAPIALLGRAAPVLSVGAQLGVNTASELVALA